MSQKRILQVASQYRGARLDRFLADSLQDESISREKVKRAIKDGQVSINDDVCTTPKTKLEEGATVTVTLAVQEASVEPEAGELDILYRDKHLIVLNKPAGLTVHPCPSCTEGTLVHRLVHHFPELAAMEGFRPGIVHRIDKDTSGLLIVALTEQARIRLSEAFAARQIHKQYLALLKGVPEKTEGTIKDPIGRHPNIKVKMAVVNSGKPAHSDYRVVFSSHRFSLAEVTIHTGRTHQIRVHMSHAGHPLWGDATYGGAAKPDAETARLANRQMLHAWKLQFAHPVTGEALSFTCPPPDDFTHLAAHLAQRTQRVVITGLPGCGKSALLTCMEQSGLPVWSADAIVHQIYAKGGDGWHLLRGRFGDRFVPDDNSPVDRKALFEAMQKSDPVRKEVEEMIHPLIRADLESFWKTHAAEAEAALERSTPQQNNNARNRRNSAPVEKRSAPLPISAKDAENAEAGPSPLAVAEVPLFLEAGWRNNTDVLIGVDCPRAIRLKRLQTNRNWTDELLATMESWQWPEKDKMAACDIVVDNSGTEEALKTHAENVVAELTRQQEQMVKQVITTLETIWSN